MAIKKPKWLGSIMEYEKGFFQFVWRDAKRNKILYYKFLAVILVVSGTLGSLVVDFEHIDPTRSSYGIKAATCALGAAAVVFLNMVSTKPLAKPWFDSGVRAIGGLLALLAGIFWLLSETDGNIRAYIPGIVLNGLVLSSAACMAAIWGILDRVEGIYKRQRRTRDE